MRTGARIAVLLSILILLAGCMHAGRAAPAPRVRTLSGWVVYSSVVSRDPFVTQIFLKNLDSGEIKQLTDSGSNDWPRWSPDGSQIAYLSWTKENSFDIYLMDKDGSHQRPIVATVASETMANWSPDGNRIVFVSDEDGKSEIYVIDLITHVITKLTDSSDFATLPDWSSSGKYIAFESSLGGPGRSQIFIMNADGTSVKQVTIYDIDNFDGRPVWCPDDTCLVFTRFVKGVPKIMLLNLASHETTPLLKNVFAPRLMETNLGRSPQRGYITFSVNGAFYAMDMKSRIIYPLGIHALELSLYP